MDKHIEKYEYDLLLKDFEFGNILEQDEKLKILLHFDACEICRNKYVNSISDESDYISENEFNQLSEDEQYDLMRKILFKTKILALTLWSLSW